MLQAVIWTQDSNDWQIGSNPAFTNDAVVNAVQGFISSGEPIILLEHDLREATVDVGQVVSGLVDKAGRINCPIAAVFGDPQRYGGTEVESPSL